MRLALIANNYPYPTDAIAGRFIQQFATALSREGLDITVIAPVSYARRRLGPLPAKESHDGPDSSRIRVLRPRFVSFSAKDCLVANTGRLTQRQFNESVLRIVGSLEIKPDIFYGHFLYEAGYAAVVAGRAWKRPSTVAVGEGTFWSLKPFGFSRARKHFEDVAGVLAVSSVTGRAVNERLGVPVDKIRVFPNGVDLGRFHPRDRANACVAFGIPTDTFNIVFVGSANEDKGARRLMEAVDGLRDVRLALVGRGLEKLSGPSIAFAGELAHEDVAGIMGTGDAFVLPTTIEGSCNALIEALASGLPIVTSKGEFNDDIVDDAVAIRVDPLDVRAIRVAVMDLIANPERRHEMSAASSARAARFDIGLRAQEVAVWLREVLDAYHGRRN